MRTSLAKLAPLVLAAALFSACREHQGDSSSSAEQSRKRGLLIAEYSVPATADFGDCRPREVWVETARSGEHEVIVRLDAPHHGDAMRVRIAGLDEMQYRGVWSERNGPPYERWAAPKPLPGKLRLERNGKAVEIERKAR
jgi:hypothetical protein